MDVLDYSIQYLQRVLDSDDYGFRVDTGTWESGGKTLHSHEYWELKFYGDSKANGQPPILVVLSPPGIIHDSVDLERLRQGLGIVLQQNHFICGYHQQGICCDLERWKEDGLFSLCKLLETIQSYYAAPEALPEEMRRLLQRLLFTALIHLLSTIGKDVRHGSNPVFAACWYMEHNYADCDLTVPAIAAFAAHSQQNLNRLFRLQKKCSVWQYLLRLRLDHARQLLENSTMPVQEVARLAGFADRVNFCKYFTRIVGASPTAYRAQHAPPTPRS